MSRAPGHDRSVNVTDGRLIVPMVVLAVPIVFANMLQVGYNLADTFWVGRLGQSAVSAISFSWAIVFLLISLAAGFSVAGAVLVAQNKGAGNTESIGHVAGQTLSLVFVIALILSIIGYVLAPALLRLVGAVPGTAEHTLAVEYTRTMFIGIPVVFGFFVFQSLLQGWGDTRTPLYLMAFGVALNVIVDPFVILGFQDNVLFAWVGLEHLETTLYDRTGFAGFGVQGAAIATILSRGIGAAIGIWLLLTGRVGIQLSLTDFRLEWGTIRTIFRIGAPASVEMSMTAISVSVLTALVAITGAEAVAAYGIGTRVISMVVLPAIGLARAVETVVGQNLGAGQVARAKHGVFAASGLIAGSLLVFSTGVYLGASWIIGIFITGPGAGSVTAIGAEYLRIVGATFVFLGIFYVIQGGFRGSGSTRVAMAFAFLGFIVLRASLAYVFSVPVGLGSTGIWYGEAFANILMVTAAGAFFLRGTWAEQTVVEPRGRHARRNHLDRDDDSVANGGVDEP